MSCFHQSHEFRGRDQGDIFGAPPANNHNFLILADLVQYRCEPFPQAGVSSLNCHKPFSTYLAYSITVRLSRR